MESKSLVEQLQEIDEKLRNELQMYNQDNRPQLPVQILSYCRCYVWNAMEALNEYQEISVKGEIIADPDTGRGTGYETNTSIH